MNTRTLIIAALVSTAALLPLSAEPQRGHSGGGDRLLRDPDVLEKLNLSDEQMGKLEENKREQQKKRIRNHSDMQLKQIDLKAELDKDTVDTQKIDTLIDEITELHKQNLQAFTDSILTTREILTDEQWKTFKKSVFNKMLSGGRGGQRKDSGKYWRGKE